MILIIFCCILSLTLLCHKFGIAKNYALFGVVFLKFGSCKKYDKSQVWTPKETCKNPPIYHHDSTKTAPRQTKTPKETFKNPPRYHLTLQRHHQDKPRHPKTLARILHDITWHHQDTIKTNQDTQNHLRESSKISPWHHQDTTKTNRYTKDTCKSPPRYHHDTTKIPPRQTNTPKTLARVLQHTTMTPTRHHQDKPRHPKILARILQDITITQPRHHQDQPRQQQTLVRILQDITTTPPRYHTAPLEVATLEGVFFLGSQSCQTFVALCRHSGKTVQAKLSNKNTIFHDTRA